MSLGHANLQVFAFRNHTVVIRTQMMRVGDTGLRVVKRTPSVRVMQAPGERVAQNVAELRRQRGHTVLTLSAELDKLGRNTLPSAITKIERGERRAPADALVA